MSTSYSLWLKRGWYYCGVSTKGKQHTFALYTQNKKQANIKAQIKCDELTGMSLSDILHHYLTCDLSRAKATNDFAKFFMQDFINFIDGDRPASQIKKQHILAYEKYLEEVRKNNVTSRKIKLGMLRAIFNRAWNDELIEVRPFRGYKIRRANSRKEYLSSTEVRKLLDTSDEHRLYQAYIKFLLYTGCRCGELKNLKWSDIKEHHLEFNGKTGKREFPKTPEVEESLKQIRKYVLRRKRHGYVLVDINGHWLGKHSQLGKIVKKYIRKAGLSELYCTHTLRHTYCSHLVLAGEPLYRVSKLAGHSSIKVTEMYAHLDPKLLNTRVVY